MELPRNDDSRLWRVEKLFDDVVEGGVVGVLLVRRAKLVAGDPGVLGVVAELTLDRPSRGLALALRRWPLSGGSKSVAVLSFASLPLSEKSDKGAGKVSSRRPGIENPSLLRYSAGSWYVGVFELCTRDWRSRTNLEWA